MKKITLLMSALLFTVMSFAGVVTFTPADFEGQGTTSTGSPVTVTKDGVTVSCDKGYGTSYALRCYTDGVVTISATENIASLEFAFDTYNDRYYNGGLEESYTVGANTWNVTLSSQARFTSITVTLGEGGTTTPEQPEEPTEPETPVEPETPEVPEGVITCAEAVAICEATGTTSTTESYTIQGYVTEIKTVWSEQYGNITFWMADTKDGGRVLQCYRVKPVNAEEKNVKVGDYVSVKGTLVNYYGNTPEVNAGGTYTILAAAEGGETPDTPVEPEEPETPSVETVGDGTEANPFTVEDVIALNNTLSGTHYVKAYIVGQATGASFTTGLDMEAPFEGADGATQGTNLAIASSLTPDVANIIPVQLPKGALRDDFNLVENPEMLGKEVVICGELIKYFGLTGIKNPTSIVVVEDSEATGLENVIATDKVAKVIKNGQIYIIKGGKTYNALGAEVK